MENSETDYEALRAQQAQELAGRNVEVMQGPHLSAFLRGFPPDDNAIITPRAFLDALESGRVPQSETPMNLAREALQDLLGGPALDSVRLKQVFNAPAPEALSMASFLKPSAPGA